MVYDKLAILDVETTGAAAPYDRIIEIGIVVVENNKVVRKFETLLNPEVTISPFIEKLTGISSNELLSAPLFSDIKSDLAELLDGAIFVAHNARFDYSFIKSEFKRIGIPFSAKQLCTVKLSRTLFPSFTHHNLDSIIERFGISCERRHRALDDALVVWEFLQKVQSGISSEKLKSACDKILKKPSLPPLLRHGEIELLPEAAGVYLFYGKGEIPLYIGKSINIRDRVLSHFANDTESTTEMEISQQVERIETIQTGGELSALILESELIKKMQPIHNRRLRNTRKLVILKKKITKDGYFSLDISSGEEIQNSDIEDIIGIFKSKKSAKAHLVYLVKEHALCESLLGVQRTVSPCFSYRLGWCKGACAGKENPILYNSRFIIAFSKTKLRTWPFNGPILVREKSEEMEEGLIFHKWCYLGKYSEYLYEETDGQMAISDFDVYKILDSFLRNKNNFKKITTLDKLLDSSSLSQGAF